MKSSVEDAAVTFVSGRVSTIYGGTGGLCTGVLTSALECNMRQHLRPGRLIRGSRDRGVLRRIVRVTLRAGLRIVIVLIALDAGYRVS